MTSLKKDSRIFLSPPHIGGEEERFVKEAFQSNYIAPCGPQVDAFEQELCEKVGVSHAVAVSSGTAALHLALHGLGVKAGDTVITSTLTFIASATPTIFQGARPIFIDSDRISWNMDPELLKQELKYLEKQRDLPKAVVPTDVYGQCVDIDRIVEACEPYDIPVVVDAAASLGSSYKGRSAGTGGRAAIFSFNGNKIITTSGGGMLVSDDEDLINHSLVFSQQARDPVPHFQHSRVGFNYRLSNVLAAIGRGQLKVLDKWVEARRKIFSYYKESLSDIPGIEFMPEAPYGRVNRWLTVILITPKEFGADREELRLALEENNIESRPIFKPMHLQPVFQGYRVRGGAVSEDLFDRGLCLPSGSAMSSNDLDRAIEVIRRVSEHPGRHIEFTSSKSVR